MASIVQKYIDNLQSISDKIPQIAKQAINENSSEIVMLVKSKQLGIGLNSKGQPLAWEDNGQSGTGFYSPGTQGKFEDDMRGSVGGNSVGKPFGRPYNFSWSGATLDMMSLKTSSGDSFEIFSADSKASMLEGIYGEIFQLTPEHNEYVNNEIILPYLLNYVLQNLMNV